MRLAHRRTNPALPGFVGRAEPSVSEALGVIGAVLLPEQHPGHATAAQFPLDLAPIRNRALGHRRRDLRREEQQLEILVVEPVQKRPSQADRARALQITVHDPVADAEHARDCTLTQSLGMTKAKDVSNTAHRQSRSGHRESSLIERGIP